MDVTLWFVNGPRADLLRAPQPSTLLDTDPQGAEERALARESEHPGAGGRRPHSAVPIRPQVPAVWHLRLGRARPAGLEAAHLLLRGLGGGANSGSRQQPQPELGASPGPCSKATTKPPAAWRWGEGTAGRRGWQGWQDWQGAPWVWAPRLDPKPESWK